MLTYTNVHYTVNKVHISHFTEGDMKWKSLSTVWLNIVLNGSYKSNKNVSKERDRLQ